MSASPSIRKLKIGKLDAFLSLPTAPTPKSASNCCCCILTHGASGDANSGRLPLYAESLASKGVATIRFTCPSSSLETRARAFRDAVGYARGELGLRGRIAFGGHSMGARAAAVAAAAELAEEKKKKSHHHRLSAVFLSSFPLHAPGKASSGPFRDEQLLELFRVPSQRDEDNNEKLVVVVARGSRDAFSSQGPWQRTRAAAEKASSSSSSRLVVVDVEGGDHGLKVSQANGGEEAALAAIEEATAAVAEALLAPLPAAATSTDDEKSKPSKGKTKASTTTTATTATKRRRKE